MMYATGRILLCFVTFLYFCSALQADLHTIGSTRSHPNRTSWATPLPSRVPSVSLKSPPSTANSSNSILFNLTSTPSKQFASKSKSTSFSITPTSFSITLTSLSNTLTPSSHISNSTSFSTTSTSRYNTSTSSLTESTSRSHTSTPSLTEFTSTQSFTTPTAWSTTYTVKGHQTLRVTKDEALKSLFRGGKGGGIIEVAEDVCRRGRSRCFRRQTFPIYLGEAIFIVIISKAAIHEWTLKDIKLPEPPQTPTPTKSSTKSSTSSATSTSTTSTSLPTASCYLIFPKDGSNSQSNAAFKRKLEKVSVPNTITVVPQVNGVAFFTANITILVAKILSIFPYVSLQQILTA
jgi:hypothetical protein